MIKFIFPWGYNDDCPNGPRPMGKWICIDGFVFMDVGIKVLFDQCPRDREHYSLQPNELIVSSCLLEPNELRELVVQHINPNLQQPSNGYVMMGFCL
jgi:hypothetical protein